MSALPEWLLHEYSDDCTCVQCAEARVKAQRVSGVLKNYRIESLACRAEDSYDVWLAFENDLEDTPCETISVLCFVD